MTACSPSQPVSKPISRLFKTNVLDAGDLSSVIAIQNAMLSIIVHDIRSTNHDPDGGRGENDSFMQCFEDRQVFYIWMDAMAASKLSAGPVFDLILEGKPLNCVDKAWQRRKGWSRKLLIKALKLHQVVQSDWRAKETRLTA